MCGHMTTDSPPPAKTEIKHRRAEVVAVLTDAVLAACGVSTGPEFGGSEGEGAGDSEAEPGEDESTS